MPTDPEAAAPLRFTLDDGTAVLFRPVRPEDRSYLREGLERLSPESRLTRFFAPISHLTDAQLRYLTEIDQEHHVAWGALSADAEGEVLGLAVGRFAELADEPGVAEVAVTVADAYQHRGLGRLLFALLYVSAHRHGLRALRAVILLQNQQLVRGLHALGGTVEYHDGVAYVDLPVVERLADLPDTPEAAGFSALLRRVSAAIEARGRDGDQSQNVA